MSDQEGERVVENGQEGPVNGAIEALNAKIAGLFDKERSLLEIFRRNWINPLHMSQEQRKLLLNKRNEIFGFLILVRNIWTCFERVRQASDIFFLSALQLMEKYNVSNNQVFSTVALLLDIVMYSRLADDQLKNSIHLPLVIFTIACKVCKACCLFSCFHSTYLGLCSVSSHCVSLDARPGALRVVHSLPQHPEFHARQLDCSDAAVSCHERSGGSWCCWV